MSTASTYRWLSAGAAKIKGGRTVDDLVSTVDLAPTFLEAAGIKDHPMQLEGRSLMNIFTSSKSGVLTSSGRPYMPPASGTLPRAGTTWGTPSAPCARPTISTSGTSSPSRWPAGDPQKYEDDGTLGPMHDAYHDIDDFNESPLITRREEAGINKYFHLAVDKRPEVELYDIRKDPYCLTNLAEEPAHQATRDKLEEQLKEYLTKTNDPRMGRRREDIRVLHPV